MLYNKTFKRQDVKMSRHLKQVCRPDRSRR